MQSKVAQGQALRRWRKELFRRRLHRRCRQRSTSGHCGRNSHEIRGHLWASYIQTENIITVNGLSVLKYLTWAGVGYHEALNPVSSVCIYTCRHALFPKQLCCRGSGGFKVYEESGAVVGFGVAQKTIVFLLFFGLERRISREIA